jgi:lipoprotein-anchoring transpeptidase ErfK/SrfK
VCALIVRSSARTSLGGAIKDDPESPMQTTRYATFRLYATLLLASGPVGAQAPAANTVDGSYIASSVLLAPGEFDWHPELSTAGPVLIVVSIDDQLAYVYRNGVRIGTTTVSTGRPGFDTPTGVYNILERKTMHHSNLYDDAPMPFMQRLTWDGVALHAGRIPGRPASHGCVRLPLEFARKLFDVTYRGTTVVVTGAASMASLDFASVPADVAQLVLDAPWRAAAFPGSLANVDAAPMAGGGGRARAD